MPSICSVVDLVVVTTIMTFVFFFHRWNHFSSVHHSWSQGNHILEFGVESWKRTRFLKFRFTKVLCTGYKECRDVKSTGCIPYFTFLFLHTDVFLQDDRECLMERRQDYRISGPLIIDLVITILDPTMFLCVYFFIMKNTEKKVLNFSKSFKKDVPFQVKVCKVLL